MTAESHLAGTIWTKVGQCSAFQLGDLLSLQLDMFPQFAAGTISPRFQGDRANAVSFIILENRCSTIPFQNILQIGGEGGNEPPESLRKGFETPPPYSPYIIFCLPFFLLCILFGQIP